MKITAIISAVLACAPACAQEFSPEFYAGVLGGLAPTYGREALHSPSDSAAISAGAFAGVNFTSDAMIYGLEIAAASDFGKTTVQEFYQPNTIAPMPQLVGISTCTGCTFTPGVVTRYENQGGQLSNEALSYLYVETLARPSLVGRVGMSAGDWTIYGKAGLGVTYQKQTSVTDNRGIVNCESTRYETHFEGVSGGESTQRTFATECVNPTSGQLTSTVSDTWTPVVVGGLGAEYEIQRYFVRGEVEMTHVLYGGSTVRAHAGLGIKF